MADYTEKASLVIVDGSSAKITKINQALNGLARTAAQTQAALSKLGGGGAANRISATAKAVNSLARALAKLPNKVNIGVNLKGNSAAELRSMAKAMSQYKSASRNINTLVNAGGGTSNFSNLDVLTQKLVRVARAANLAQIALGKMKANMPGRGNFNMPGGGRNPPPPPPRSIGLEIQPFKSFWRSAMVSLGHTITSSIREGFAEGVKGYDVAENKFRQQRITGQTATDLRKQAFEGEQRAPIWRADERMNFYAEIASNFKDPRDAAKLDQVVEKAIYTAVQQGGNRSEATEGIAQLFKGLGNAGYLQDAQGNLNKDVEKYINAYIAAKVSEGQEINFRDAGQLLKYARTSAQSMTDREFFLQLIASADIGSSSQGVQLNQFMKNFAGETTKKAIKAQEDAGLREEGRMVKSGQIGKRTSYTYEAGAVKDEDLLRENPTQWIAKYIMGKGGFLERKGLDPFKSSPAEITAALDPLAGNRNVDDFLAKRVLQYQESMIKAQKALENPQTNAEMDATNRQSSWVQLQETIQQVTSLFGNLGDKLENTFIPVIDTVGNWAERLNQFIEGKSKGDMTDYAVVAGAGAGVAGAGFAAWKVAGWLSSGFGLPAAAAALSTSAAQLSAAAAQLAGGNALPGGGGPTSKKNTWTSWLGTLGAYGAAAAGIFVPGSSRNDGTKEEARSTRAFGEELATKKQVDDYLSKVNRQQEDQTALQNLLQQIANIQGNIDLAKSRGNEAYAMVAQGQLMTLQTQAGMLQQQMQDRSSEIVSAFDTASTRITTASNEFGANVSEQMMGLASSFGSTAGAAMRQAFGSIAFTVPPALQGKAPNTGTNTNTQTGG